MTDGILALGGPIHAQFIKDPKEDQWIYPLEQTEGPLIQTFTYRREMVGAGDAKPMPFLVPEGLDSDRAKVAEFVFHGLVDIATTRHPLAGRLLMDTLLIKSENIAQDAIRYETQFQFYPVGHNGRVPTEPFRTLESRCEISRSAFLQRRDSDRYLEVTLRQALHSAFDKLCDEWIDKLKKGQP